MEENKVLEENELEKVNGGLASDEYQDLKEGDILFLIQDGVRTARVSYNNWKWNPGVAWQMRLYCRIINIYINDGRYIEYDDSTGMKRYYLDASCYFARGDLEK